MKIILRFVVAEHSPHVSAILLALAPAIPKWGKKHEIDSIIFVSALLIASANSDPGLVLATWLTRIRQIR